MITEPACSAGLMAAIARPAARTSAEVTKACDGGRGFGTMVVPDAAGDALAETAGVLTGRAGSPLEAGPAEAVGPADVRGGAERGWFGRTLVSGRLDPGDEDATDEVAEAAGEGVDTTDDAGAPVGAGFVQPVGSNETAAISRTAALDSLPRFGCTWTA